MANFRWRGDAPALAQVTTATPANVEVGDAFLLFINGKVVSYIAAAATVADVVAGLVAAVNSSTLAEFAEIAATDEGGGTEVTFTAKTPGKPFTVTSLAINGGASDTQTLTLNQVTTSLGPHHWNAGANWSAGAIPGNNDDVFIEDSDVSILYGLDQSSATLGSLRIAASFTGEIGLPRTNVDGPAPYIEYRERYLTIGADTIEIGRGDGGASGRIQLDTGSAATALLVHRTGLPAEDDLSAVLWKGDHAANVLEVLDGSVTAAPFGGETATLAILRQVGGDVRCRAGVSLTTIERSGGGRLLIETGATTLRQSSGETTVSGDGAVGTLDLRGGRVDFRSDGTISTATVDGENAVLDFSDDLRGRTVTTASLKRGTILDPHETVTWSNGIQPAVGLRAV